MGLQKQGPHPDPQDPSVTSQPANWSPRRRAAYASPYMPMFRNALLLPPSTSVRDSIIDDLSTYYGIPHDECVRRCINWESWSVEEWHQAERAGDPVVEFYQTTKSWAFDLSWYVYLQSEGLMHPVSVAIANCLSRPSQGGRHLDFGSGIGTTSQLFVAMGWESQLADISRPLLDFARYRWKRRGLDPQTLDLNTEPLPENRYDVITAIDTLFLIPNFDDVLAKLHRALRPGGLLFANFDARPKTEENAWHLYEDDLPLRWKLHRAGFEPQESLDGMVTRYQRVETHGPEHMLRGARDTVLLRGPLRPAYRAGRSSLRRVLQKARA